MPLQEGLRSGDRAAAAAPPLSLASDRRGRTPLLALPSPAPLTFQDYLKEADLQFLDAMRRGTSLNLADLASDPPPQTLQAWSPPAWLWPAFPWSLQRGSGAASD